MQNAFGAAPTTSIPPHNTGDESTLKALSGLGFTVYSSYSGEFGSGGILTLKPQLLDISEDATYASLVSQTQALLSNPSVNDIVITYHNWQFEANRTAHDVNAAKVEMLRQYIQYLKTNNVEFTTLNGANPGHQVTDITLATSNPSPAVNEPVTFTVTLTSGTTGLSKPVHLWCMLNGVRIERGMFNTVNGVYSFTEPFSIKGQIVYHAEFAGDSSYASSTSEVTISVH
jgi:hypothetical protein